VSDARLVTVAIAVRDGAPLLGEAIRSALDQTHAPVEVVVVDDGSTDTSAAVAEAFGPPVRVVRIPPSGIGAARNAGIVASRGAFLSFLDADDVFVPGKTAAQLRLLDASPSLDAVFGWARQVVVRPDLAPRVRIPAEVAPVAIPNTVLIRRAALGRVGPFSGVPAGQGIDWALRVREAGLRTAMLPEVVYIRRIHGANQGLARPDLARHRLAVLKASLDRQRRAGPAGAGGGPAPDPG
jgi:glycosyltransferase involved in cell wall biosynthesis